jgi:hypothetical protein
LSLLRDENDDSPPKTSSTAKKVYKKNAETHEIIKTWEIFLILLCKIKNIIPRNLHCKFLGTQ